MFGMFFSAIVIGGLAEAAARTLPDTSLGVELSGSDIIPELTLPVIIIHRDGDTVKRAEAFISSSDLGPDARVVHAGAHCFLYPENPHMVADLPRNLFNNDNSNRTSMVSSHNVNFKSPPRNTFN